MSRCKHCLAKVEPKDSHCPVCGIQTEKDKAALSPDEKKVRYHARIIRIIAMLHLIGTAVSVMVALSYTHLAVAAGVLVLINLALAIGLSRFAFWAYRLATVYYFLIGMVNVVSVNIPGILVILILLYVVGNGTARAIFERRFS
jgi:predicted nucleic acid-binding Zn ribbon protein